MTDIQPYQFELEKTLQDEDDPRYFEKRVRRTANTDWCLCEPCVPMDSRFL